MQVHVIYKWTWAGTPAEAGSKRLAKSGSTGELSDRLAKSGCTGDRLKETQVQEGHMSIREKTPQILE
uniref:Uncharacterized protein n=1 Tax=Zea mays TaxID=4577 RepID=A0A804MAN2_MAIZE